MQRQHQEGPAAARIHDDCNKPGVHSTERAVPSDAGDADVIVALVVLHCLAKHMPEFALSYHSPHCVCREKEWQRVVSHMQGCAACQKASRGLVTLLSPGPTAAQCSFTQCCIHRELPADLLSSQVVLRLKNNTGCLIPDTTKPHVQGCFTEGARWLSVSTAIVDALSAAKEVPNPKSSF